MSKKDLPPKAKGPAPATIPPEPEAIQGAIKNSKGPAPFTFPKPQD